MRAIPRNVEIYEMASGSAPFEDWIGGLTDLQGSAAIDARIGLLRRGSLGKFRSIGNGLMELKINSGPGYRVYLAERKEFINPPRWL
jgi:putative addiction module killer protein